jgi:hypothetical protein
LSLEPDQQPICEWTTGDQRLKTCRRRERGKGMKRVTARVLTLALVVVAAMAIPGIARADDVANWDGKTGNGSDKLPCPFGAHWVLSPGGGVTEASLVVDGKPAIDMTQNGSGSWTATSDEPVDENSTASAAWKGTQDPAPTLKLSHCLEGTTTTTTEPGTTTTANTGFNALPFVGLGLLLLAGGTFALRRRAI